MDWEFVFAQLVYLLIAPRKAYQFVLFRKQTKNQFSRDDPGMILVLCGLMMVAGLSYAVAYRVSVGGLFYSVLLPPIYFVLSGVLISTLIYSLANKYLVQASQPVSVYDPIPDTGSLEWLYCFDIHCNATWPMFLSCTVLQFFLLPVLVGKSLVSTCLSNFLYALAGSYYCYITSLGYAVVPFMSSSNSFLLPIPLIVSLCCLMTVLNVNCSRMFVWLFIAPLGD